MLNLGVVINSLTSQYQISQFKILKNDPLELYSYLNKLNNYYNSSSLNKCNLGKSSTKLDNIFYK